MPRFTFEKFPGAEPLLDHLDEIGRRGDGDRPQLRRIGAEGAALAGDRAQRLRRGRDRRRRERRQGRGQGGAGQALARPAAADRPGLPPRACDRRDPRRLPVRSVVPERIREIVEAEERVRRDGLPQDRTGAAAAEADGVLRRAAGRLAGLDEDAVAARRARPRRAPGLQAHRHLRRRVRLADAVHVLRPTRATGSTSPNARPSRASGAR